MSGIKSVAVLVPQHVAESYRDKLMEAGLQATIRRYGSYYDVLVKAQDWNQADLIVYGQSIRNRIA